MALNRDNIQKLIDHLRIIPREAFDMRNWVKGPVRDDMTRAGAEKVIQKQRSGGGCETVACIAGEAALLAVAIGDAPPPSQYGYSLYAEKVGREWLGLTEDQARKLFLPGCGSFVSPERIDRVRKAVTPLQAADVLENLLKTGKVAWRRVGVRFS